MKQTQKTDKTKQLSRSELDKVLGGVAGGISSYFDVDSNIVRFAFILITLLGGAGIPLYFILWILLPRESTYKKKEDIIKQIIKVGLETKDDSFDYLLTLPIHSLSKEKLEALKNELKEKKEELKEVKNSKISDVYYSELEELKKKIS